MKRPGRSILTACEPIADGDTAATVGGGGGMLGGGGVEAGVGVKEGHGRMRGLRECVCVCARGMGRWMG